MATRLEWPLARNAVQVHGEGRPVVLVHGYGCDQTMWDGFLEAWTGPEAMVTYDLTGMGISDQASYGRHHATLQGHADDLLEILDALDRGPVVAVGHSVSAIIVGLAAAKRPELFDALVMVCPNPCYVDDGDYHGGFSAETIDGLLEAVESNYQGWAGRLAGMVAGPEAEETAKRLDERFCANDPWIMKHFAEVTFRSDNRQDLHKIHTPTLVIQSADDAIAPPPVGEFVVDRLPHGDLVTLPSRGHAPHMTHPRETVHAIQGFLAGLP